MIDFCQQSPKLYLAMWNICIVNSLKPFWRKHLSCSQKFSFNWIPKSDLFHWNFVQSTKIYHCYVSAYYIWPIISACQHLLKSWCWHVVYSLSMPTSCHVHLAWVCSLSSDKPPEMANGNVLFFYWIQSTKRKLKSLRETCKDKYLLIQNKDLVDRHACFWQFLHCLSWCVSWYCERIKPGASGNLKGILMYRELG